MKYFISYGRDVSQFVGPLRDDLTGSGYDVWMDTSDIRSGDDWRERITTGIIESDVVLAFLSSYGLRPDGVCLDEIAIAVQCNKTILTFLMEPDIEDMIPSTVRSIQYYDLTGWTRRGSMAPEEWYEKVSDDLLDHIFRDKGNDRDWLGILEARLHPHIVRGVELSRLRQLFVDRPWIDTAVEKWIRDPLQSRILILSGFPGFGKSFYCDNFSNNDSYIVCISLSEAGGTDRDDISKIIRNLAYHIAVNLPSYGKKLLWITEEFADEIPRMSGEQLFNTLVADPLITEIDGGHAPLILVLDGIDRITSQGDNQLAEIIASASGVMPDFVHIIISTRKDPAVLRYFNSAPKITVEPGAAEVRQDIERYLRRRFDTTGQSCSGITEAIPEIAAKCSGSFIQAKLISDEIISGSVGPDEINRIPDQLYDVFFQWMHRIVPDENTFINSYYDAFAILAAAIRPVPVSLMRKALSWRKPEFMAFMRKFSILLLERKDGNNELAISLFHPSFREWICDENGNADIYIVDPEDGMEIICDTYLGQYADGALADEQIPDMLSYLSSGGRGSELKKLCNDISFAERIVRIGREACGRREHFIRGTELLRYYRELCVRYSEAGADMERVTEAEIPYIIAAGSFRYGDMYTAEQELCRAISRIRQYGDAGMYMESLYMLGTGQDWLGQRNSSLEVFRELRDVSDREDNDEYRIKALAGLIWNDHFTNAEEGMRYLEQLKKVGAASEGSELTISLIEARILLSMGKLREALDIYIRTAGSASDDLWGYDSISVKNQMLMLEILVACFDNEEYTEGVATGEKMYERLSGHGNIAECYCASWIAANAMKAGLYDKAEEYLRTAEKIDSGAQKTRSAWISMHLKSIRAFLDAETGRTEEALRGHLSVIDLAEACNDDWVLGDACFEYLQLSYIRGLRAEQAIRVSEKLRDVAERTGLPHLIAKARVIGMVNGSEIIDFDYLEECVSADYSSTDMIVLLHLIGRLIKDKYAVTGEAAYSAMLDKIVESVRNRIHVIALLNEDSPYTETTAVKLAMEELEIEL